MRKQSDTLRHPGLSARPQAQTGARAGARPGPAARPPGRGRARLARALAAALVCATGARAQDAAAPDAPRAAPPAMSAPAAPFPPPPSPAERQAAARAQAQALLDRMAAAPEEEAARIARRVAQMWSRSGSDTADLLLLRGRRALESGAPDRAAEHLSALVEIAPDFAEAWHSRAAAWFALDRPGLALADLERALALEPRHWGALAGLGATLEQIGRLPEALAAYRASLVVNPAQPDIREAARRLAPQVEGLAL
ncbi:Tetratricopeptide repeat-containing protein [Oceanicella actignis]|nr:Tetratricopeptide repeat-containing protein [Oceanicella actignis]